MLIIRSAMAFNSIVHSLNKSLTLKQRNWFHDAWTVNRFHTNCQDRKGSLHEHMRSFCCYLSFRTVATIDAPWMGGFEYMGLITSFSWLSTLLATSAFLQTCSTVNKRKIKAIKLECQLRHHPSIFMPQRFLWMKKKCLLILIIPSTLPRILIFIFKLQALAV